MSSTTTSSTVATESDVAAIGNIPMRMADAWNRGDARAFAAPFAPTADFVAFEGTHLKGRVEIVNFHQPLFDTVLNGTRLYAEVRFVRLLNPTLAVMHAAARYDPDGGDEPSPSRDSMQLFVTTKRDGTWIVEAMQNSRQLTLERQQFLDDLDDLSPADRQRVTEFVASLRGR